MQIMQQLSRGQEIRFCFIGLAAALRRSYVSGLGIICRYGKAYFTKPLTVS